MRSWMKVALAAMLVGCGGAAAAPVHRVLDRIPGPDGGWDYLRVDPAHNRVLITRGASVMAVDLTTGKVTPSLVSGSRFHIALPIKAGAEILVTDGGADTAMFVDAVTGVTLATVATGKGPDAAAFDPSSGLVLVVDHDGGDMTLIDAASHQKAGSVAVGGELEEVAVDGAGRAFVNVESKNEIAVIDIAGRAVIARYPLTGCDGPTGLAYDSADKLLLAACDGATDLLSARTGKVVRTLHTGKGADGVAYDSVRRLAFVPAGRDGTMAVIALSHGEGRIVETVPTQLSARTIALDERTGRLYLPAAQYVFPAGGGRPTITPGSFRLLVVGK